MSITVDAIVGSTGLELKVDPGVPYVYAGFAGLSVTAGSPACAITVPGSGRASRSFGVGKTNLVWVAQCCAPPAPQV